MLAMHSGTQDLRSIYPGFGHPTEEMGYVYYVCGVTHMPPTSSTGDEQLRNKVMERLKVAHDQLEALKQKKEEKEVVQEKSKT
jgi:hypothetical protein